MDILQTDKRRAPVQSRLHISNISRVLLLLYIITMPFVSAFAFTGTISLPLICAVFLFGIMVLQVIAAGGFPAGFIGYDLLIVGLLIALCILSYTGNGLGNAKSLNHTIAYFTSFLIFYCAVKLAFFKIGDQQAFYLQILRCITLVVFLNALYVNIEFLLVNFTDINLNEIIPRPSDEEKEYNPLVVGLFIRARGFAPESGHYAFMMELFSPLAIYYVFFSGVCRLSRFWRIIFLVSLITSLLFAASTASFLVIPLAFLITTFFYAGRLIGFLKRNIGKVMLVTTISGGLLILINQLFPLGLIVLFSITDKADSTSFYDREARLNFFYEQFSGFDFVHKIIGAGPSGFDILGFDSSKSILSLYYSVIFELGIAGLLLLVALLLYSIYTAASIRTKLGFFLTAGLIAGSIHYYFISNYWYPWFWFLAALTTFIRKKNNQSIAT